uniref:Eukaryotic translation initiation factor 3 subunit A n=1 Tax=Macrostomum lignano TaxID=282301 RepID=A0A1I8FUH8_9PLAT
MPQYFNKPENALKRAQEFLEVDKKESALDILAEVMKSKRHRQWNKVHEDIMLMFLDLCVELRRNQIFKEVIHQYKNMTLNVSPSSLIDIVRKYLEQADRKTEEARQKSKDAVSAEQDEVDDLDVIETPESLMMSAVSGETTQDRSDRAILVPWLKFMWESYRQCLDLLRNNNKLERLYHDVAQMAFRFCEKYGRKTEFRKLNDILRSHLLKFQAQLASGQPVPPTGVNLNNPDTQGYHLETRLSQLEFSMNLELYNEAYKSIEDIWNLVTLSKKSPKPSIMANYYTKVALVFWKCGSHLFHAAALHKLFNLHREHKKNMASDELQTMASTVLCATLAIPLPFVRDRHADSLLESGEIASSAKQKMLCSLLGMPIPPSRRSLCADLVRGGIVELAHPELASLHAQLEQRFQPLKLADRCAPGLQNIRSNDRLAHYARPIEDMLICRTLIQTAQVYASITLPRFATLFPFCDRLRLETTVVEAARNLEIPVRIDHRRGSLLFGGFSQLGISQREEGVLSDGPSVKTADQLSKQLVLLGSALQGVLTIIQPEKDAQIEQRKALAHKYGQTASRDHQKLLQRKELIEERKEYLEQLQQRREEEEHMKQRQQQERIQQLESERMEQDVKRRQLERKEIEQRNIQLKVKKERIEVLKGTEAGRRAFANLDDANIEDINADEVFARHVEKERRELMERIKTQEKKLDHLARAKRLEEIPLLTAEYEKRAEEARQRHEKAEAERLRTLKEQHARLLQLKQEAQKIMPFKAEFEDEILSERRSEFDRRMDEWRQRLETARKERLAERKLQRERDRREEFVRQRLAELAAQREAKERAAREEKERQMQEENRKKQQHYEQQKAKLDEQAKAQAQKEAEIEERLKAQREGGGTSAASGPGEKWRPAGGSNGGASSAFGSSRKSIPPRRGDDSARGAADASGTPSRRQDERGESGGAWRSQAAPRAQQAAPAAAASSGEADGWTTVSKKK